MMRGDRPLGRNKTDRELRAIAERGGVVGINTIGWMLDRDGDGRADVEDFLAHADHCVRLIGIDHVGISSDAIVDGWAPDDIHYADAVLASPDRWWVVAQRLRDDYEYDDEMLRKLLGANFLRVYDAVLPGLGAPTLSTVESAAAELSWLPAAARGVEAPSYTVTVEERVGGEFIPFRHEEGIDTTSIRLDGLERGVTYRWQVVARSGRLSTSSASSTFSVR